MDFMAMLVKRVTPESISNKL